MSAEPLQDLLDRVRAGDPEAGEQLVADYGPALRRFIHRTLPACLRPRLDPADVVQSVWAQVLTGLRSRTWHFPDPAYLRAFLVKVARRRLIARLRRQPPAARREEAPGTDLDALPAAGQPRPSETAQAEELWGRMLGLCLPDHRELLHLRRQGLGLVEIARRTGLHEGSVRRILRGLARQLAFLQEPLTPPTEDAT